MKHLTLLACSLPLLRDGPAQSPIATLIQNGERAAALETIDAPDADVNTTQGDGTTPLHWAVYKVDHELVAALLNRGAKADVTNDYGSSPLAEAVKLGDLATRRAID